MSKYQLGHDHAMAEAMPAVLKLLDSLANARRDSAEWKQQHENLLAMFRASEERAAKAEASLRSATPANARAVAEKCAEIAQAMWQEVKDIERYDSGHLSRLVHQIKTYAATLPDAPQTVATASAQEVFDNWSAYLRPVDREDFKAQLFALVQPPA